MNKHVKVLVSALTVLLISTTLVGCKSNSSSTTPAATKTPKDLVVWSHLTDPEIAAIKPIAEEWAKKTGNTVKVVTDKSDFQAYLQAANSSKGPDIMFGIPHDNLGTFYKAKLLAEVPSTVLDKSKYPDVAVKAVTYDGKQYAVPLSIESIGLFYNTEKIPTPPKTIDELMTAAKQFGFKFDVNNLYFNFPFIAGNGGYIFKDNNGTLDPSDLGIGNAGAIKGYQMIQDLVIKNKFMPADIKGDIANGEFKAGKTGLYISGPWDIDGFKKANVKFAVAPMPTIDGKPMPTFVGVQTGYVSAKSKNQAEAMDLLKYLANNASDALYKTGNRIPAQTAEADKVKSDKNIAAIIDQVKVGIPMPNIAETGSIWKMNDSYMLLTTGKLTAEGYAKKATDDVKAAIAQQK